MNHVDSIVQACTIRPFSQYVSLTVASPATGGLDTSYFGLTSVVCNVHIYTTWATEISTWWALMQGDVRAHLVVGHHPYLAAVWALDLVCVSFRSMS